MKKILAVLVISMFTMASVALAEGEAGAPPAGDAGTPPAGDSPKPAKKHGHKHHKHKKKAAADAAAQ